MPKAAIVHWLQLAAALGWLPAACYFAPSSLAVLRGRGDMFDRFRAINAFIAFTQIGFTIRWWIFPRAIHAMGGAESAAWSMLYVLSASQGLLLWRIARDFDRARP